MLPHVRVNRKGGKDSITVVKAGCIKAVSSVTVMTWSRCGQTKKHKHIA